MAKGRTEIVAASLLGAWTDSDTAMQIVGSSLGVFGTGRIDPARVLSDETPLRNALFDVLLSLVEGGALEMRTTADSHYAFRWREDVEVAGLAPETFTTIDMPVPSPLAAELERTRAERDEALGRADFAEALAAERERLLRLNEAAIRAAAAPAPDAAAPAADPRVSDKVPAETPLVTKPARRKPAARATTASKAPKKPKRTKVTAPAPTTREPSEVVYLPQPPAADPDAAAALDESIDGTEDHETAAPRRKWSGYAIDTSRSHLSRVDPVGDVG